MSFGEMFLSRNLDMKALRRQETSTQATIDHSFARSRLPNVAKPKAETDPERFQEESYWVWENLASRSYLKFRHCR